VEAQVNYVGRFAPSPTGALHFGSVVAALASYLDARHHHGKWLLRIEDLDPPREQPEAPGLIIEQLKHMGFRWDGEVSYQSQHLSKYDDYLNQLQRAGKLFPCTCSRKSFDKVYPGTCRNRDRPDGDPFAIRLQVIDAQVSFDDLILGPQTFDLENDIGDFVLKRKDGLFAYQLAVVADDHDQHITHIIRGADLLDSTPRQSYLAQCLNFETPQFGHIPVMVDSSGHKLSKQAHARPIALDESNHILKLALQVLGQPAPDESDNRVLLESAALQWSLGRIPSQLSIPSPVL
jgi:glutamyl-Q tRNA(Asp) synthetase